MIEKLRAYIQSLERYADRFDMAEATELYYNQAYGALMFAVEAGLVSTEEALNLWEVELSNTWKKILERNR